MGSLTVTPTSTANDTYISSAATTTSYGDEPSIYVGYKTGKASAAYRGLIEFDISSIPLTSTISAATFTVNGNSFSDDSASKPCTVYIVRKDFTEDATWLKYDDSFIGDWTNPGGDFESTPNLGFTLTQGQTINGLQELAQHALENQSGALRLLFKANDETATQGYAVWKSSDHSSSTGIPSLALTYTTTHQWVGGTSSDASVAANWSTNTLPIAGDVVQFASGSVACTSGSITCGELFIGPGYTGNIGASSSQVSVTTTDLKVTRRTGQTHINATATNVHINGIASSEAANSLGGTIANLYVVKSAAPLSVSANVTNLYAIPRTKSRASIKTTVAPDDVNVFAKGAAIVDLLGNANNITAIDQALVTVRDNTGAGVTGTIELRNTAKINYLGLGHASGSAGIQGNITLYGGELTTKDSTASSILLESSLTIYEGATLIN